LLTASACRGALAALAAGQAAEIAARAAAHRSSLRALDEAAEAAREQAAARAAQAAAAAESSLEDTLRGLRTAEVERRAALDALAEAAAARVGADAARAAAVAARAAAEAEARAAAEALAAARADAAEARSVTEALAAALKEATTSALVAAAAGRGASDCGAPGSRLLPAAAAAAPATRAPPRPLPSPPPPALPLPAAAAGAPPPRAFSAFAHEELARCSQYEAVLERQRDALAAAREELAGERRAWKAAAAALGAGARGDRRARQELLRVSREQLEARSVRLNHEMAEWNAAAAFVQEKRGEAERLLAAAEGGAPGWEGACATLQARLLARDTLEARAAEKR
jgi:hypothetical protein